MAVDLKSVRDRLAATARFTSVTDIESAAAAMETATKPNAAFVCVASERAAPNRTQGVHDQAVDCTVAVLLCLPAQRADSERKDRVEEARLAVIGDLAGWTPEGARRAFDYEAYNVVRMGAGLIWLQVTFKTGWHLRITP